MSLQAKDQAGRATSRVPKAWAVALLVLVVTVATYFQFFHDLWPLWTDTSARTYTHGPLIVVISGWLIWRELSNLGDRKAQPVLFAVPVVLILSLAWMTLAKANILTLHTWLWPVLALAVLVAAVGWRSAGRFAFPVLFLWFSVPIWDHLNGLLQSLTVLAVHLLTVLTRVPAEIVGNIVVIPQGRFEIASGCSGLHFFLVGLAIAALAGEIHRDRIPVRLGLIALGAAIALFSNWFRVYLIILAGYLTDMQSYLVRVDHYKFGWLVFAIAMVGFFLVLRRLPAKPKEVPFEMGEPSGKVSPTGALLIAIAAIVAFPAASAVSWKLASPIDPEIDLARDVPGFSGPLSPSPIWEPRFVGAAFEVRAAYLSTQGKVIDFYANVYVDQRQGKELIGYQNRLFDSKAFMSTSRRSTYMDTESGYLPVVEQHMETSRGGAWMSLYYYDVNGRYVANELQAQLVEGFLAVWGPVKSGIRAVAMPCDDDCTVATVELGNLLSAMLRTEK